MTIQTWDDAEADYHAEMSRDEISWDDLTAEQQEQIILEQEAAADVAAEIRQERAYLGGGGWDY
jgi:hypothetical protein